MKKHSTFVRTLVGMLVALLLLLAIWATIHRVRGGAELPPPNWSEADLVLLPPDAENAWGVIGPLAEMPDFTIDPALWDDSVPIPEDARPAVDAELARPEVRLLRLSSRSSFPCGSSAQTLRGIRLLSWCAPMVRSVTWTSCCESPNLRCAREMPDRSSS